MKNAKIFLVEGKGKLTPMAETNYVKEDELQALLENYPDLLPGDQINTDEPRRWLLVARELGVPGSEDETGRWSLDHLFLDQDGIPTFVECKRSTDTRARREVVSQMLDYAANGISYWKMDRLREAAETTAQKTGRHLETEIQRLVDSDETSSVDDFWKDVEHNMKSGNVRLLFVADTIPTELRRLVEFLNEQMTNTEVLAVEVKQFIGDNKQKVIVPRLIGMTETAREIKRSSTRTRTNWEEFNSKCTPETSQFFRHVLDIADEHGHTTFWGSSGFSIRLAFPEQENLVSIAYGYAPKTFQLIFGYLPWPEEQVSTLRKEIYGFKIFKETPYTMSAILTKDNLKTAEDAYLLMMQRVEESLKNKPGE